MYFVPLLKQCWRYTLWYSWNISTFPATYSIVLLAIIISTKILTYETRIIFTDCQFIKSSKDLNSIHTFDIEVRSKPIVISITYCETISQNLATLTNSNLWSYLSALLRLVVQIIIFTLWGCGEFTWSSFKTWLGMCVIMVIYLVIWGFMHGISAN